MGMFSECAAANEAKGLKIVLQAAKDSSNMDVAEFAKRHILPLYLSALSESCVFEKEDKSLVAWYERL